MAPKMLTKLMGHKKSTTSQEERRKETQEQSQAPNPDTSEPLRRNPKRQATGGGSSSQQRKDKGPMNINVEDNPDPSRRPTREQLLNPCKGNRVLFRDDGAFTRFHGTCGEQRAIVECYHFRLPPLHTMAEWEWKFLNDRIDFWGWREIIEEDCTGYSMLTRLFYANMVKNKPNEPFGFSTHIFGHTIDITPAIISATFNLPQEGEETYTVHHWPQGLVREEYKSWIATTDTKCNRGDRMYANHLPSVHHLLFLIINNILLAKATIKTNLENSVIYYLRHLLQMDKKIDISYVVVRHMIQAGHTPNMALPFSHLIYKLVGTNLGTIRVPHPVLSINLVTIMPKYKWVSVEYGDGRVVWSPNEESVNSWIKNPDAVINQYWDPNESSSPPHTSSPPSSQSDAPPPNPYMPFQDQLTQISVQLMGLSTWSSEFGAQMTSEMAGIRANQYGISNRMDEFGRRLDAFDARFDQIDQFHTTLQTNWDATHGHWNVPGAAFDPNALTPEDDQAGGNHNDMDED